MRAAYLLSTALAAALLATPAQAHREVSPYIEVQQVLNADLSDGDVLTYTSVAAGVDASVAAKRVEASISYRYERLIPWDGDLRGYDVHSGLARGSYQLIPNTLTLNAGAIASRARSGIGGGVPDLFFGDSRGVSQVYGFYAGPSFRERYGPLQVTADYQFGYVKVHDKTDIGLGRAFDSFDSSTTHMLNASVGMPSGDLPFGWTVSGGLQREDSRQLDQRYDAAFVRGDVTVPVSPTVALTAGAGYENIELSERPPIRAANGAPLVDEDGDYVTDKNAPRRLTYDQDGLIWDVGVIWRPSRRTTLQLRGGRRYGDWAVTGSFDWQIDPASGLHIGIYNGVESFGRRLTGGLALLPTDFEVVRNPFTNDINGCVFGATPGRGACFSDELEGVSSANYKSRGVNILYSAQRGVWTLGAGAGYNQRKYVAPVFRGPGLVTLAGVTDEIWTVDASLGRSLTANSSLGLTANGSWYDSGVPGGLDLFSASGTGSYYRSFTDRLRGQASVGLSYVDQDAFDSWVAAQLLLGARYQF
jgi:hypothetical protein